MNADSQVHTEVALFSKMVKRRMAPFAVPTLLLTLCLILSGSSLFAGLRYGEKVVTIITAQKVNLRTDPEMTPETILTQVAGGSQLRLLSKMQDWFRVSLPDGKDAWLSAVYGREDVARDLVRVKVPVARVRADRSTDSAMVTRLQEGIFLRPLEIIENWVRVKLPDDSEGWIRGDLLEVRRVSREDTLEDSSTHTLLILASVGSGVSAFSFVLVMTIMMRRKQQAASYGTRSHSYS
jgi:SH3-like domain-containing protein